MSHSSPPPGDAEAWARLLRHNWEQRSRSHLRDFYVASHHGWDRDPVWRAQAEIDVTGQFHDTDPAVTRPWHVLEIGCGVGRLVAPMLARVATYTGFDVAEGMVDEARRRHTDEPRARFFVGDGTGVPEAAKDRRYDLAIAHAVFIHCPRVVIRANLVSAMAQLRVGGQLRFQVIADPDDPEGAPPPEVAATVYAEIQQIENDAAGEPVHEEMIGSYYMGDRFGFAELRRFLAEAVPADTRIYRPSPYHMYVMLTKTTAPAGDR